MKQRVFIRVARGFDLSKKDRSFNWGIAKYFDFQGFIAELFSFEEPISESKLVHKSCSLITLKILIIRCSEAIILGLERSYGIFRTEKQQKDCLDIIRSGIPFVILVDKYINSRSLKQLL